MSITVEDVVKATGAKKIGGRYMACCPVHKENTPSFTIEQGKKTELALKCFGCHAEFKDLLNAIVELEPSLKAKLKKQDVQFITYEHETGKYIVPVRLGDEAPAGIDRVHVYPDENGKPVKIKVKFTSKKFWQYHWSPSLRHKIAGNKNGKAPELPYPLDKLVKWSNAGKHIFFTEGEKDQENFVEFMNMPCITFGGTGNKWRGRYASYFEGCAGVIIIADNDWKKKKNLGVEYANHIAAGFKSISIPVKIITMPDKHKDFSDWMEAGGKKEDLISLVKETDPWDEPEFKVPDSLPNDVVPIEIDKGADISAVNFYIDSDSKNAERLAYFYGDRIRYAPKMGWYHYNGKFWELDEDELTVQEYAKTISKKIKASISHQPMIYRDALEKWAKTSESRTSIKNMIALASSDPKIKIQSNVFDDDSTKHLWNCKNGTVDLMTGEIRPHRAEDYITMYSPYDFSPNHDIKLWLKHLDFAFGGDRKQIEQFQLIVGYMMTGFTYWKAIQHWHGVPDSGKSQVQKALAMIWGTYSGDLSPESIVKTTNRPAGAEDDIADTECRRIIWISEVRKQHKFDESALTAISGGDNFRVKKMAKSKKTLRGYGKIIFTGNQRPDFSQEAATWTRLMEVPFNYVVPRDKMIENFGELLVRECAPGIVAWAQEGAAKASIKTLRAVPEIWEQQKQEWRDEVNLEKQWFDECAVEDSTSEVTTQAVYDSYSAWCERTGNIRYRKNKVWFGRAMSDMDRPAEKEKNSLGYRYYKGFRIVSVD